MAMIKKLSFLLVFIALTALAQGRWVDSKSKKQDHDTESTTESCQDSSISSLDGSPATNGTTATPDPGSMGKPSLLSFFLNLVSAIVDFFKVLVTGTRKYYGVMNDGTVVLVNGTAIRRDGMIITLNKTAIMLNESDVEKTVEKVEQTGINLNEAARNNEPKPKVERH